ncbi:MAG: GNAT family N-acetyltransferase [Bacteroidetes bacterium]|nr:GNAT family N-acetyltransferase [Bacteroidota bacterium]
MQKPFLQVNKNTSLRLPSLEMCDALFDIINDQRSYLGKWLPWVENIHTITHAKAFLYDAVRYNQGGQRFTTFIFFKNELVGSVSLVRINKEQRKGELGYWLSRELQGKGIVSNSCKTLLDFVFKNKNLERIEIRSEKMNHRSVNVPIRLGFTFEGTLRKSLFIHDEFFDLDMYSLLKEEWVKIKN